MPIWVLVLLIVDASFIGDCIHLDGSVPAASQEVIDDRNQGNHYQNIDESAADMTCQADCP
jgi:hypothetical protein